MSAHVARRSGTARALARAPRRAARTLGDDPGAFYVLLGVALATLAAAAASTGDVAPNGDGSLLAVVTWMTLCAVSNVLPVPSTRNVYLSMSTPVNIAIAALFAPGFAAAIVTASAVSEWELRRETTLLHAVYNRVQLGLSTAGAGVVFAVVGDDTPTIAGAVLAVVAYHVLNSTLVAFAEATARRTPLRRAVRGLLPPGVVASLSYLALGLMGVALAAVFREVGGWAVALLITPLLGARVAVAASGKLARAQRAQRMLANRLIDERERERVRIAANIHDVVLQDLAAVQLVSANIRAAMRAAEFGMAEHLASELESHAGDTIRGLREAIADLRRTTLDEAGLDTTLSQYVRAFAAQTGIDVSLTTHAVVDLPLAVSLLLYECCQEALQNVARHAGATHVRIGLRRQGAAVELEIADDGIGIDGERSGGVGLALMSDKVELSGGSLVVRSVRIGGTEVVVTIPLAESDLLEPVSQ